MITLVLQSYGSEKEYRRAIFSIWSCFAQSGISAEDVASDVYQAIKKNTFMIISHAVSRKQLLVKRFFPKLFMNKKIKFFLKIMKNINSEKK